MLTDVLPYLRCPVCRAPLAAHDGGVPRAGDTNCNADGAGAVRALRCPAGHSFDVARQGYVDLMTGRVRHAGDSAEMVAARDEFLRTGHFDMVATGLVEAVGSPAPDDRAGPIVVDAGAGTGAYLAAVLDALPGAVGLALDLSKAAVRRAARAHPSAAAVRCDTWRPLPVADACADLVLNVFAPRNGGEFARILRPRGALIVVTPLPDHLGEVIGPLGLLRVDPAKDDRTGAALRHHFDRVALHVLRRRLRLSHRDVTALVRMGPSARHTDPADLASAIAALPEPVTVTAAVQLAVYRCRPGS
ncbi:putative RNA methyltransferase [Solwaraspora sp. WMMD792]|uniref:putative RNA methyltransferase n=1 Tax=Solwaraspora sp. WMMD792 TaxID=3016099 RepID=UPI0024162253|nr:methyltransferase domain-containing protein [Solwaraspora sp. WMMD792]MDG4772949.1 methyltransferase domain-containing protein [Solwaraspora sp. WMMD792]